MVNVCSFSIGMFLWVDQTTSKNLHKLYQIRKHSSRMSVPFGGGGDPQVNKFKQVPCVMSRGLELGRPLEDPLEKGVLCLRVPCSGGWALYNEVQCIMGNGHMGPPPSPPYGYNDSQTWLKTLPSYSFVGGRFQLNANCLLAERCTGNIVNKYEYIWSESPLWWCPCCTSLNMSWGPGSFYSGSGVRLGPC